MTASPRRQRAGATALAIIGILSLMAAFMPGIADADHNDTHNPTGQQGEGGSNTCKDQDDFGAGDSGVHTDEEGEVNLSWSTSGDWGAITWVDNGGDGKLEIADIEDGYTIDLCLKKRSGEGSIEYAGPFDPDSFGDDEVIEVYFSDDEYMSHYAVRWVYEAPDTFEVLPAKVWLGDVHEDAEATIEVQVNGDTAGTFLFNADGDVIDGNGDVIEDPAPVQLPAGTEYTVVETSVVTGDEDFTCDNVTGDLAEPAVNTIYNECAEGEEPQTFEVNPAKVWLGDVHEDAQATIEVQVGGEEGETYTLVFDAAGEIISGSEQLPIVLEVGTGYTVVETGWVSGDDDYTCDNVTENLSDRALDTIYNECDEEEIVVTVQPTTFTVTPDKEWVGVDAPAGAVATIEVQVDGGATYEFEFDAAGDIISGNENLLPIVLVAGTDYTIVETEVVTGDEDVECDFAGLEGDTVVNECTSVGGETEDNDSGEGTGSEGNELELEAEAQVEIGGIEAAPQMLPRTGLSSLPLALGGAVSLLSGLGLARVSRRSTED